MSGNQMEWRPDPKDVEVLAREVCKLRGVDPDRIVTSSHPMRMPDGVWSVPAEQFQMPQWHVYGDHVHAVLYALWEQGRLLPPSKPVEPESESDDDPAGADVVSIDLSDLKIYAVPQSAAERWKEAQGL